MESKCISSAPAIKHDGGRITADGRLRLDALSPGIQGVDHASAHDVAIRTEPASEVAVALAEMALHVRLLGDHEAQVEQQEEGRRHEQRREAAEQQPEAGQHQQHAEVHRVAREAVGAGLDQRR
jgi:hypothetical protein